MGLNRTSPRKKMTPDASDFSVFGLQTCVIPDLCLLNEGVGHGGVRMLGTRCSETVWRACVYFMGDGYLCGCCTIDKTKILPPGVAAFLLLNWGKVIKSQTSACRHQTCPISKTGWYKSL